MLFPLAIVSNGLAPTQRMPAVLRVIADWNPVSAVTAAGLVPPSPRRCRSDAERCRPSRDARGRVRRRAALLPDPGRLVIEGPGRPGPRPARRDQQDRDGERPPAEERLYGWFQELADIEAQATVLRWYEPLVVPGLLQTEDYARGPPEHFGPNGWPPSSGASSIGVPGRCPS
jgi:hypothetical protein